MGNIVNIGGVEHFVYGDCQSCWQPITRPKNVGQVGMHNAKVCDACWFEAAFAYSQEETNTGEVARQFGLSRVAVWEKFAGLGVTATGLEARNVSNRRVQYKRRQNQTGSASRRRVNQAVMRMYHDQRGTYCREYKHEQYIKHRNKKREQANV